MVWVALVLAAAGPYDSAMAKAVSLYNDAEWDASLRELTKAERYATEDAQRINVWLHQGIVLANIPDMEAAKKAWERALVIDPHVKLPLKVSPRVAAKFEEVQNEVRAREKTPSMTAPLVGEPPPERAPEQAKGLPMVSIVTLALGVAAAAVGLGFGLGANAQVGAARAAMYQDDKSRLHDQAQTFAIVANTSYGVAGVFGLWALISFLVVE
jgi:hypothetical protein